MRTKRHILSDAAKALLSDIVADGSQPIEIVGAGEGNRTLVISLEGCCSTIELHPHWRIPFALWRSLVKNAATGSHETCRLRRRGVAQVRVRVRHTVKTAVRQSTRTGRERLLRH